MTTYPYGRRRAFVALGVVASVALAALLGVAVGRSLRRTPSAPARPQTAASAGGRLVAGVPVGYARTRPAAAAAAMNYVPALGRLPLLGEAARRAALSALVAPGAIGRVTAALGRCPDLPAMPLPGCGADTTLMRLVPISARVLKYDGRSATVDVWTVTLTATRHSRVIDTAWSTETVTLGWYGDWKVRQVASRLGPVPATYQPPSLWPVAGVELRELVDVRHAPVG